MGSGAIGADWPASSLFDFSNTYMDVPAAAAGEGPRPYAELAAAVRGWRRQQSASAVPYVPFVASGWDPRPWRDPRPAFAFPTRDEFEAELRQAAADLDATPRFGLPLPGGGRQKSLTIYAWNEFGEGGIVAPTKGEGHRKLEAIRAVFGGAPAPAGTPAGAARPSVWIGPPPLDNGRCLRELFEKPEQWAEARAGVDVLTYADHHLQRQFTDDELRAWLPRLDAWGVRLSLETGAVKPWGPTAETAFAAERPIWERVQRLGGTLHAVAMDEPLCCAREQIHVPDDDAARETAAFVALVRKHFPGVRVGDIEPYPSIPLADHVAWIAGLEKRLADLGVRGLDFYRLDVDWVHFVVHNRGSWREVKQLELHCRERKLPFGLIYWAADYPALEKRGMADDATWYVSTMQQGYDYALVDGAPDQIVLQSWVNGPRRTVSDTAEFTFTRTVRDFVRTFTPRGR